jgi:glutaminyl-peptide cyclotransferase
MGMVKLSAMGGLVWLCFSCNGHETPSKTSYEPEIKIAPSPSLPPAFNADSAYAFIQNQVDFGPRVPNSKGHTDCGKWLRRTLERFTPHVLIQEATVTAYTGELLQLKNIMARFNPEATERIVFFAHWDTRPFADNDPEHPSKPILGADDGGSGTAVILEMARQLSTSPFPLKIGVDFVLFDGEDFGHSGGDASTYCLGSQYWSKSPHVPNYTARFGILLDMVGAEKAVFPKEAISRQFARDVVENVWNIAMQLGYGNYFKPVYTSGGITDDHYFVNTLIRIPTIDIINYDETRGKSGFPSHWHTHNDNMNIIDRNTLQAVGSVLMEVIQRENQTSQNL